MRNSLVSRLALAGCLLAGPAAAQDAARGAALYLQLPGGQPSCVECHGPDPQGNRNRLLTAAGGPAVIALAITKVGAMGYLGELLDARDRADLSAYLARVNVLDTAPLLVWPRVLEFGRVGVGAAVPEQSVRLLNAGAQAVAVLPALAAAAGFSLRHDCPPLLAPAAACTAQVALSTAEPARRTTALQWRGDVDGLPQWIGLQASVEPAAAGALVADLPGPNPGLTLQAAPGQPVVAEVWMVNAGIAALSLGAAVITGPGAAAFSLAGSACSTALLLQPGERCRARITATAAAAGRRAAVLQWRTDGANLPPLPLEVVADSTVAPAPAPSQPPASPTTPTPPTSPTSPSPPATGTTSPSPAPGPAPVAPQGQGASGGCAMAWPGGAADPLLPGLLLVAGLALLLRRRGVPRVGPALAPAWACHTTFTLRS